jgi:sulfate/thiosulfate transport system ATP-binding protein
VTTGFVTHDQEEAMEVAEQIVVLNEGRIEQVGTPKQPYEEPANEFEPAEGAAEAMIDRVLHLGFEVRVELTLGDGEKTWVQTTTWHAEELELTDGEIVWLRPADAPVAA